MDGWIKEEKNTASGHLEFQNIDVVNQATKSVPAALAREPELFCR